MRRKWGVGRLLLSWVAYWATVFAIKLGPAVVAIWRLAHMPDSEHGDVSFNVSNTVLSLTVKYNGHVTWAGTTSFLVLAGWIGLGPLVLWLLWMWLGARSVVPGERVGA